MFKVGDEVKFQIVKCIFTLRSDKNNLCKNYTYSCLCKDLENLSVIIEHNDSSRWDFKVKFSSGLTYYTHKENLTFSIETSISRKALRLLEKI